jgi:outer membrane receptor for ferrienterochelin and colicins
MRIRFVSRMLAVLGFFAAAGAADAQNAGSIAGRVTETGGTPVPAATVLVQTGNTTVATGQTGDDGAYRVANVPAGTYAVIVRRVGFSAKRTENVTVNAGATTTLDVALAPMAAQLDQVVTTTTRGAEPEKILDSPNSISLISSERIAERPSATVTDHLKGTPGLSISNGGIVQANIVSRGFNNAFSTSMLMLQDYRFAGVPSLRVNVPFLFTGTGEDIDRIEVLQGPASALYGPNSGAGVLHVITKSPFTSTGTTLTLDGGERSMFRLAGRHAGTISNTLAYKFSGEYFRANDWEYNDPNESGVNNSGNYGTDPRIPASRQGTAISRDFALNKYSGEARLDWKPNEDTEAITTFGYTMAGSALEITTTFGAAQVQNWSYTNFQQRFRHKQFFAQVFYNSSNSGNDDPLDDNGTFYLRSGIPVVDKSSVLVAQAQQGYTLGRTKLVAGVDYIATTPETEGTIMGRNEDDDNISEVGGYLQFTQPLTDKLYLMGAVRGDMNSRIEGTQFSPRAALLYKVSATQNFRFTFNRAFNSPASFSFFLDQWSGSTPAPGIPAQILGNPAKEGWTYDRGCTSTVNGGLCMRSPYTGNVRMESSVAAGYPAFANALTTIVPNLPLSATFTQAQRDGLVAALAGPVGVIVRSLVPTATQTPSVMIDPNTATPITNAANVRDIAPLAANFSNTWELGYKAIIGDRLRISADYWYQIRPAEPTTQVVNPGVHFAPTQLGGFLQTNIIARLQSDYGMSPAAAAATAAAVVPGLTQIMARIPQGTIGFTSPLYNQPFFVVTYQNGRGTVDARGFDLALDYLFDEMWSVEATYSKLNRNIYGDAPGASPLNPLAANTPKNRGSLTVRRVDEVRGMNMEVRGRYMDAFAANSGVFNSYGINVGGTNSIRYDPVPVNAFVDVGFSWRLPVAQQIRWSINIQNLLDNQVPSFIGVAPVGRFATTRIQYSF